MKKILVLLFYFSAYNLFIAQKKQLFPQVFFDQKSAEIQLGKGKSTIEGTAFTREKRHIALGFKAKLGKKHTARPNTVVMLFPVTDYFMEFYKLRKNRETRSTQVLMSPEAFYMRKEAYTDEYGRFKFENLKVGKYFLETIVDFTAVGSYQGQVGNTNYYNAMGGYLYSTPIYETYFYTYEDAHRETKFVEITRDGQVIEINL